MSHKNNFVKHLRILYYQSYLTKINNRKILIYPSPHKKKKNHTFKHESRNFIGLTSLPFYYVTIIYLFNYFLLQV